MTTRLKFLATALFLLLALTCTSASAASWVIVHAGWLLDRPGEPRRREASVIIRDGEVVRMVDDFTTADSLEPVKYADLIAVVADPLADVTVLEDVVFVMKGCTVFKSP